MIRKNNHFEFIPEVFPMPFSPLMLSLLVLALEAEAVTEFRKQGSASGDWWSSRRAGLARVVRVQGLAG